VRADRRTRPGPAADSLQSEPRSGEPQPGDRRFDTIQAHVADDGVGNLSADGQTAHRSTTPITARWTEDGFGSLAGSSETTEPAAMDRAARLHLVFGRGRREARVRPRGRAGDERQEGSRPQRCGTAADEEETFAGWRASGDDGHSPRSFGFDDRSARNLANPRPGTGCDMPGAVNGGNRRGGEKPRGRSETGGVATVGRRRISILREWTFTGPSGDGPSQGRSSRRGRTPRTAR